MLLETPHEHYTGHGKSFGGPYPQQWDSMLTLTVYLGARSEPWERVSFTTTVTIPQPMSLVVGADKDRHTFPQFLRVLAFSS